LELTSNAVKVLEKRYLTKDEEGKPVETVEQMLERVAKCIALVDKQYGSDNIEKVQNDFYKMMENLEFLPNSPTLMNAGKELGQLSACFVIPIEDSMEGIFDAIKSAALIHKSGGGTGFSFSKLRPKGSTVKSTGGVASGPVSFMKVFNAATEAVKQGGTRRGANMGILRVDHPDILEFIECKKNNSDITNFNISIGITDIFMKAVEENGEYELISPHKKEVRGILNAREIFNKIVEMAWRNGEPGMVFLDRMEGANPTPDVGKIESTNPCGEQPLLPYESCNLGSINLLKMLKKTEGEIQIDFDKLEKVIFNAVHFLDNVIDANRYPLKEIEEITKKNRKIGLGVMGFADMLIELRIPYNSQEAVETAEKIMEFIHKKAREKSSELAEQRGAFPNFEKSVYKSKEFKLRNATTTTIAPTGTISIIAGVSSGIEPLFAVSYFRNVMDNDCLIEVNPQFEKAAKEEGFYSGELMERIAEKGHVFGIDDVPLSIQEVFITAHEISPEWHIRMQAAFQRHVDNAVSKTINFKKEATKKEVEEAYLLAYQLGCKGLTIYRDSSREGQVLNVGKTDEIKAKDSIEGNIPIQPIKPRQRPEITSGMSEKVKIGCGNLYITVNYDQEGICEIFTNLGRAGGCPSQSEATSRLASIALRSGVSVESIIEQLKGIRCHSTLRKRTSDKDIRVLSCPDAIGRALERVMNKKVNIEANISDFAYDLEENSNNIANECHCPVDSTKKEQGSGNDVYDFSVENQNCSECGAKYIYASGCMICTECGYSVCG
jgi:ribonucleoside-diphosphate reductase alpha chain